METVGAVLPGVTVTGLLVVVCPWPSLVWSLTVMVPAVV